MENVFIRRPMQGEAYVLTSLVLRSKAYWGYSKEFLGSVERELTITEDYLKNAVAFIAESNCQPVGIVGLSLKRDELEFLFIDPEHIGKGVGKILWDRFVLELHALDIRSFKILSDPGAESFYQKMGAKRIGMAMSSVRMLPLLEFAIT
jgi:GNAT superfamily N-acetyltransferase